MRQHAAYAKQTRQLLEEKASLSASVRRLEHELDSCKHVHMQDVAALQEAAESLSLACKQKVSCPEILFDLCWRLLSSCRTDTTQDTYIEQLGKEKSGLKQRIKRLMECNSENLQKLQESLRHSRALSRNLSQAEHDKSSLERQLLEWKTVHQFEGKQAEQEDCSGGSQHKFSPHFNHLSLEVVKLQDQSLDQALRMSLLCSQLRCSVERTFDDNKHVQNV